MESVKIKKMIKKISRKKENSNIMIIENDNVKNFNARLSTMYYINDTISFASSIILKFLFEFENCSKKESNTKAKEKNSKKKKTSRK